MSVSIKTSFQLLIGGFGQFLNRVRNGSNYGFRSVSEKHEEHRYVMLRYVIICITQNRT